MSDLAAHEKFFDEDGVPKDTSSEATSLPPPAVKPPPAAEPPAPPEAGSPPLPDQLPPEIRTAMDDIIGKANQLLLSSGELRELVNDEHAAEAEETQTYAAWLEAKDTTRQTRRAVHATAQTLDDHRVALDDSISAFVKIFDDK